MSSHDRKISPITERAMKRTRRAHHPLLNRNEKSLFQKTLEKLNRRRSDSMTHLYFKTISNLKRPPSNEDKSNQVLSLNIEQEIKQSLSLQQIPNNNMKERDPGLLIPLAIHGNCEDDLKRLINRISLSFSTKKKESQFHIRHGIFGGCSFHLMLDGNDASLSINNASDTAQNLLEGNKKMLETRLSFREINLRDILFT